MAMSVEMLSLEIARALELLRGRLAAGEIETLFAELGLPAPDVLLGVPGVIAAVGGTVAELDDLPPRIAALANAIEAEDVEAIVEELAVLAPLVQGVVAGVGAIGSAVGAAAPGAGPARAELEVFAAALPERFMGYAISTYLEREHPVLASTLGLLGIVELTEHAATANVPAHVERRVRFDLLGPFLDDPVKALARIYGWGSPDFDWDLLLRRLARFAAMTSGFAFVQPDPQGGPSVLRIAFVDIGRTDDPVPGLRAALRVEFDEQVDVEVPLRPGLDLELGLETGLETGTAIDLLPPGDLRVDPPSVAVEGRVRLGVGATGPDGRPLTLLGLAGSSGIFAGRVRASAGADLTWDVGAGTADAQFVIEIAVEDGEFAIDLSGADGFLAAILPNGGIRVGFDVLAGFSSDRGVYFEGGAALAVDIPVDLDLGPIRIQMLHLELDVGSKRLRLEASGAISARLGPFAMAVERMGTQAVLSFPSGGGNLGLANVGFEFKPPAGIGLTLDAGIVKGGGFLSFDSEAGEYAGVLELSFASVSIKAVGILTTELPSGAEGWSLLLLVFGEFTPVQLGFGFTLTGVGGIIGLQHGVSIRALQDGLRTGVVDAVLFPRDPVANAPALLGRLRAVFPVVPRALTVGPALKLGWSTPALVTLKLGLILQLDNVLGSGPGQPSFSRIVLLGQLKVQIPPVDELGSDAPALIQLQVDVVGAYDMTAQELSIDAVLRDSHIALLPVQGSMVVRARFGAAPTFLLAVGGFHPRFTDLPPGIPPQERVGIQLHYGIVTVRIVGYVAITSNSFQTGAEANLVAAGGGFRVEAFLGFDALFLFEPRFHFEIDFRVGAAVKYKSISLASLTVRGSLTGPGRWEVAGHATISLLFFDIGIDFSVAWGEADAPALPTVAVGPLLQNALSQREAWHAELPGSDPLVSLRTVDIGDDVVAHPLGSLIATQKVVPLGQDVVRVGRSRPSDGPRYDITQVTVGGQQEIPGFRDEHFARAEYFDLTEEQKLSTPSFERFRAGIAVSTDAYAVPTTQITFEPEWETANLRQEQDIPFTVVRADVLAHLAAFGASAASAFGTARKLAVDDVRIAVVPGAFGVATESAPAASATAPATFSEAMALAGGVKGGYVADVAELAVAP
ncbi:DUF6603 domain-containing protein [Streptomyces sp. NBC_00564]|uniref:DUF6603 domain-containing protein n=1 Tax=Streptomyces sp. NBC_00564 TaxID=2903663 RepID=UPI00352EEE71|nr:hypothetical protein OG256_35700 [Streptomyces sp. NBC_00564]